MQLCININLNSGLVTPNGKSITHFHTYSHFGLWCRPGLPRPGLPICNVCLSLITTDSLLHQSSLDSHIFSADCDMDFHSITENGAVNSNSSYLNDESSNSQDIQAMGITGWTMHHQVKDHDHIDLLPTKTYWYWLQQSQKGRRQTM